MPRKVFTVTREHACKRCGANEWRRRKKADSWGFDCLPCSRRRVKERRADPATALLDGARARAKQQGELCTISADDVRAVFPADMRCPVLGVPFTFGKRKHTPASPSLDRIDPTRGYVPGNIAVISRRANVVKNDATLNELEQVVQWLRGQQGVRP